MSDDDSFLSRWSRRKAQVRSGEAEFESPIAPVRVDVPPAEKADAAPPSADAGVAELAPPPTLEEVAKLRHDSDFSRFITPGVDETVKRAAMKKLFADPHFNVMDGLDTYIDDYGKPDPIPEAMLRRMTQSKFLGLFDAEPPDADAGANALPRVNSPADAAAPALPQSRAGESGVESPGPALPDDENTALRLQPDDAAQPAGAGPHRPGARS
jgi:hypothetical protein